MLVAVLAAGCLLAAAAAAQPGALFPEAFIVEHHLVQIDADGTRFATEPVTDYHGGSWLVSVRPDGSRLILDFARREATEVRPEAGTYWTVSFDRLADLAARLAEAEWRGVRETEPAETRAPGRRGAAALAEAPPALTVEELPAAQGPADGPRSAAAAASVAAARPGLQRVRVVESSRVADPQAGVEVWLDPTVRLRPAALEALAAFETTVSVGRGSTAGESGIGRHLAAARSHAAGAVPVRTARALVGPRGTAGRLEDVATRLDRLDELPRELVTVPEGLRRVPHPMEAVAAFLEADAERDRSMAGGAER